MDETTAEAVLNGVGPRLNYARFTKNTVARFAAVELEVASTRGGPVVNAACNKWHAPTVRDGSVNRGNGYEVNTAPACGDALYDQLSDILTAINSASSVIDATCGVHVHVDGRDLVYQDIQKLMILWGFIEPVMYAMVSPERYQSRFCKPCGSAYYNAVIDVIPRTSDLKQAIIDAAYTGMDVHGASITAEALLKPQPPRGGLSKPPIFYNYRRGHRNGQRYNSLNLHTWFMRGTIENRMHQGSLDLDIIFNWALMNLELVDLLPSSTLKTVKDLCSDKFLKGRVRGKYEVLLGKKHATSAVLNGLVILDELLSDHLVDFAVERIRARKS
jgi:hypothetical protein